MEEKFKTYFISYWAWSDTTNFTGRIFWTTDEYDLYSKDECMKGLEHFESYLKNENNYKNVVITNFKKLV